MACCCRADWQDTEALARQVQEVKERHYQELTAGGISAFAGAGELIARARQLGVVLGVASSGAPSKIEHNLRSSGLHQHLQQEVSSRWQGC
jgi:beta-phosphoglucomutase-like phosphatase (HAD superfamily)